jgi:hypothetical protein
MEEPIVNIVITNRSQRPVVLVKPGDESERDLRTPLTKWLVEPVAGEADGIIRSALLCGNINAPAVRGQFGGGFSGSKRSGALLRRPQALIITKVEYADGTTWTAR